jgi:ADP-ribosylglycohydrolase
MFSNASNRIVMTGLRERVRAAIMGAFAADTASMGTHWIYDPVQLLQAVGTAHEAQPEYQPQPPAPKFYSSTEYPGHYGPGQLSPYGEQLEFVTNYCRDLLVNKGDGNLSIDSRHMTAAFKDWAETFGGRPDHATKLTLENIAKGEGDKRYYGADDDQAHAYMKALPVTWLFVAAEQPLLLGDDVTAAVRVHQDNDVAVAIGHATSVLLQCMLRGMVLAEALSYTKEWASGVPNDFYEVVVKAFADAEKYAAAGLDAEAVIVAMGGDNPTYNRSCKLPAAFVVPLFLMYRLVQSDGFDGELTTDHYAQLLRENILVAGDTCSRAIFLGSVLAAGIGSVPESFLDPMDSLLRLRLDAAAAVFVDSISQDTTEEL